PTHTHHLHSFPTRRSSDLSNPRIDNQMSELKSLSKEAIPAALEKAERYRLLNEPGEAESICLDILKADPENQQAIITLLLALTEDRKSTRLNSSHRTISYA